MAQSINSGLSESLSERLGDIFQTDLLIDGAWVPAQKGGRFDVTNPATGEVLVSVADGGADDIEAAIEAATQAQPLWAAVPGPERSRVLHRWHQLVIEHREALAHLLTLEQGKPIKEALGEIDYGASYIEWFAGEATRIYGDLLPSKSEKLRPRVIKKPVGVVVAITPWNFPNAMLARKLAPALAAGCSVIVKPAAETPLSALAIAALAERAGIPAGLINVITTADSRGFGDKICADSRIHKITFTGSTPVGKTLVKQSAGTLKRLSLELGGNAPFIVFSDADIALAVKGAIASKFRNAGQTCVCANRFYVEKKVFDDFVAILLAELEQLTVGNGLEDGVNVGPLINERAVQKVAELVEEARDLGAQQIYQAILPKGLRGSFYPPTVLVNVPRAARILSEEIFGPVITLVEFEGEEQAIALANATPFGLAAYAYTNCRKRLSRLPERLHTGLLGLNTGLISNEMAPFGGVKESGWGREGSKYGLDDYLSLMSVTESYE